MKERIEQFLKESAKVKTKMAVTMTSDIERAIDVVMDCLRSGHKILICGNGGSAADAQHFAAEFTNRYKIERPPLPAIALTTDSSALTSIGNDSGFDFVFDKQIHALGQPGDILFVLTTSDISLDKNGHSTNIARALITAREKKLHTIGLVSLKSKKILEYLDIALVVPHTDTPRIQEGHITLLHIICELAEQKLFNKK